MAFTYTDMIDKAYSLLHTVKWLVLQHLSSRLEPPLVKKGAWAPVQWATSLFDLDFHWDFRWA